LRLPDQTIIAPEKFTRYLLKWQPENDKSKMLGRAGYTLGNWRELVRDIRNQFLPEEAKFVRKTAYGDMYEIRGELVGTNNVSLKIVTVWMMEYQSQKTKFITLFPDKEA
jgi:hypothetical protein